ncbi:hypothetical protein BDW72DRAFT_168968, partial [Aspergillus terricola var. indicus]
MIKDIHTYPELVNYLHCSTSTFVSASVLHRFHLLYSRAYLYLFINRVALFLLRCYDIRAYHHYFRLHHHCYRHSSASNNRECAINSSNATLSAAASTTSTLSTPVLHTASAVTRRRKRLCSWDTLAPGTHEEGAGRLGVRDSHQPDDSEIHKLNTSTQTQSQLPSLHSAYSPFAFGAARYPSRFSVLCYDGCCRSASFVLLFACSRASGTRALVSGSIKSVASLYFDKAGSDGVYSY